MPGLIRGVLLLAVILSSACSSIDPQQKTLAGEGVELHSVPFYPQRESLCGPAALATVLNTSGVEVAPDDLAPRVYLPGRRGSLQVEMQAAVRSHQRLAYRLPSTLQAIHAELLVGRPVLILQNLAVSWLPVYHYAVVVGIDPQAQSIILRSGTERRLEIPLREFANTWHRADSWALVALDSHELPADPDDKVFLAAVSHMEQAGDYTFSARAYQTALAAWPKHPVALFGLANSLMALHEYATAANFYRQLAILQPDNLLVTNNLALSIAAQGCQAQAVAMLEQALGVTTIDAEIARLLRQTLVDIEAGDEVAPAVECAGIGTGEQQHETK
jgi:tetratricopeptide (TPR) repeat protein